MAPAGVVAFRRMKGHIPMLCECNRLEGVLEHRDMNSTYVLWILDDSAAHVVFLHRKWLDGLLYTDTTPFSSLLSLKGLDESCRMISRTLLAALKYKPDYLVIVSDDGANAAPLESGCSLADMLRLADHDMRSVCAVAEGPLGENNQLGRKLCELCCVLADRGFFNDPKNRKYGLRIRDSTTS